MKFCQKKLTTFIFSSLLSGSTYFATDIAAAQSIEETKYFNPHNPVRIVGNNECVKADPLCFLQISKTPTSSFKISQICDMNQAKQAYAIPIEEQLKTGNILGREFCKGVVSISTMDLPFTKEPAGISNANDGMLLVDAARDALSKINDQLNAMQLLASKGASGIYSSSNLADFDVDFQALKNKIVKISNESNFNGFPLFSGKCISVPTSSSIDLNICMVGTIFGLNINDLTVSTNVSSQEALSRLNDALMNYVMNGFEQLDEEYRKLNIAAKHDGITTYVDMNTSDNIITRKGSEA